MLGVSRGAWSGLRVPRSYGDAVVYSLYPSRDELCEGIRLVSLPAPEGHTQSSTRVGRRTYIWEKAPTEQGEEVGHRAVL